MLITAERADAPRSFFRRNRETIIVILLGLIIFPAWISLQFPNFVEHFSTSIPGAITGSDVIHSEFWGGDHVQVFFLGWKLKQNIVHHLLPFFDPYTFSSRISPNIDMHIGIQFQLIALSDFLFGDVAGYNFAISFAPLFIGYLTSYLLLSSVTKSVLFRFFGAMALAMLPFRFVQILGGHSGGIVYVLVPLYIWGLLRQRLFPESRYADAVAGVTLLLVSISDEHQSYYLVIFSAIVFITWTVQDLVELGNAKSVFVGMLKRWRFLLLGLGCSIGYGLILNRFVLMGDGGAAKVERSLDEVASYSRSLPTFFRTLSYMNIGAIIAKTLAASIILSILLKFRRTNLTRTLKSQFLGIALALPVCAGIMVGVGSHWTQKTGLYELLFRFLPFFSYQRVPDKIFGLVAVIIVVLAAVLFENLRKSTESPEFCRLHQLALSGIAFVLLAAMVAQPIQFFWLFKSRFNSMELTRLDAGPNQLFAYLQRNAKPEDIVLLVPSGPANRREDTIDFFYAYRTGVRMASGYNGSPPDWFLKIVNTLTDFNGGKPGPDALQTARVNGYSYLLLDSNQPPPDGVAAPQVAFDAAPYLKKELCEEKYCLYRFLFAQTEATQNERTP